MILYNKSYPHCIESRPVSLPQKIYIRHEIETEKSVKALLPGLCGGYEIRIQPQNPKIRNEAFNMASVLRAYQSGGIFPKIRNNKSLIKFVCHLKRP